MTQAITACCRTWWLPTRSTTAAPSSSRAQRPSPAPSTSSGTRCVVMLNIQIERAGFLPDEGEHPMWRCVVCSGPGAGDHVRVQVGQGVPPHQQGQTPHTAHDLVQILHFYRFVGWRGLTGVLCASRLRRIVPHTHRSGAVHCLIRCVQELLDLYSNCANSTEVVQAQVRVPDCQPSHSHIIAHFQDTRIASVSTTDRTLTRT